MTLKNDLRNKTEATTSVRQVTASFILLIFGWTPKAKAANLATPSEQKLLSPVPTSLSASRSKILWDHWFTVTVYKKYRYAIYHETVKKEAGKIHYYYHSLKMEEGFTNEERLESVARDTPFLEPISFEFKSFYRSSVTEIKGQFSKNEKLNVYVKKNSKSTEPIEKVVPPHTILVGLFPVWFKLQLPFMKPEISIGFSAINEDNIELEFSPLQGNVQLDRPDEYSQSTGTTKLSVTFQNTLNLWYLDKAGIPYRLEIPSSHTLIQRTTETEAKKFLKPHY
jgi:hypothetical protein